MSKRRKVLSEKSKLKKEIAKKTKPKRTATKKRKSKATTTTTRRNIAIRHEKLYDPIDKTEKEFDIRQSEIRDANFYKFWPGKLIPFNEIATLKERNFFDSLITGGKMGSRLKRNNMIIGTYKNIAKDSGYSTKFIQRVMKKMTDTDVIVRVQNGVHMLNPDILFKGTSPSREYAKQQYDQYKLAEKNRQNGIPKVKKNNQNLLQVQEKEITSRDEKLLNGEIDIFSNKPKKGQIKCNLSDLWIMLLYLQTNKKARIRLEPCARTFDGFFKYL